MAPACFHSCVGRIRYLGVILYDADRIVEAAKKSDRDLIDAQREIILDPFDEEVIKAAKANGIHDSVIEYAQKSPVYKFVKEWKIASGLQVCKGVEDSLPPSPRIQNHAHGLLRSAASSGNGFQVR